MGLKGVGETGTIAATQAVVNAVVDALAPLGIRHVEMPMTPERVWRAIQDATRDQQAQEGNEPASPGALAESGSRSYPDGGETRVPIQQEGSAPSEREPFEGQGLIEELRAEGKATGTSAIEQHEQDSGDND
jgi:hypothetical protein